MENLFIKKINPNATIPTYATAGSAGLDLYACIDEPVTIEPNKSHLFGTGLAIALPNNEYVALIYARSGLSVKHGLIPKNCVGVIDSDYRGELCVCLQNTSDKPYTVAPNDRIAQMVISFSPRLNIVEADSLDTTDRANGGFGSSGM